MTVYDLMDMLDLNQSIAMSFFMLSEAVRPVPRINPADVFVKQIPTKLMPNELNAIQFWPLATKKAGRKRRLHSTRSTASNAGQEPSMDVDQAELPPCSDDEHHEDQDEPVHPFDVIAQDLPDKHDHAQAHDIEDVDVDMPEDTLLPDHAAELAAVQEVAAAETPLPEGQAPPPPPPLHPRIPGTRSRAQLEVVCPNGIIKFYGVNGDFVATCLQKDHGQKCRLTRTARGNDRKPAQGRPLGLLYAWLQLSACDQQTHLHLRPSLQERIDARTSLAALPDGTSLQTLERDRRLGEPIEHENCP